MTPTITQALARAAGVCDDSLAVEGAAIVTAPNLQSVPADAIRRAGFRRHAHRPSTLAVLGDAADSFVQRDAGSNLEVF